MRKYNFKIKACGRARAGKTAVFVSDTLKNKITIKEEEEIPDLLHLNFSFPLCVCRDRGADVRDGGQ